MKAVATLFLGVLAFLFFAADLTLAVDASPGDEAQLVESEQPGTPTADQAQSDRGSLEQTPDDDLKDLDQKEGGEETGQIADPLYPWNNAMYHFNDKLYFWVMKPVAQGYSYVVPEDLRISVRNVFKNLTTPVRFVSSLLQLRFKDAGNELIRFVVNSTAGVGGLADVAKQRLDISRHDEDLGQALGSYGIGQGFYIVWPFLGPSSLRDTIGSIGDGFLNPVNYITPFWSSLGVRMYDTTNETSLRIGDYEDLKEAAVDPYVSIRDAYVQNRKKAVAE